MLLFPETQRVGHVGGLFLFNDALEESSMSQGPGRCRNFDVKGQDPAVLSDYLLVDLESVKARRGGEEQQQSASSPAPLVQRSRRHRQFTKASESGADWNFRLCRFRGGRRIENAFEIRPS